VQKSEEFMLSFSAIPDPLSRSLPLGAKCVVECEREKSDREESKAARRRECWREKNANAAGWLSLLYLFLPLLLLVLFLLLFLFFFA